MRFDILVIGAGPAGLAFAASLHGSGLQVAVLEREPAGPIASPAFDGREIALTHRSVESLAALGAWARIPAGQIYPLRAARVVNGRSRSSLDFAPRLDGPGALGSLVSNHLIRRALFETASGCSDISLICGASVQGARADGGAALVSLDDGREFEARLLIAADSRFSPVRGLLGIEAEMNRLGRSMILCRVEQERDHHGVATEWFDHGRTLALLPLDPRRASAVLTVAAEEAEALATLDDRAFGMALREYYGRRWGEMSVVSTRHVYPLVTSYARRFVVPGAALVGDAAVGMHPVTAHGFNLGLRGAALLAREIRLAQRRAGDWADARVLAAYERGHRLACRPLYSGTNAIVRLFTDERPAARLARSAAIGIGRRLPLLRGAVQKTLLHA